MDLQAAQETYYDETVDYLVGSPHLAHARLHARLAEQVRSALPAADRGKPLHVLEVGAGHGGFTEVVLAAGHRVTALEMSRPAIAVLRRKFGSNDRFEVREASDQYWDEVDPIFDALLCVAVLHHIPDYVSFLQVAMTKLRPGGALITLQDPLWYSSQGRLAHRLDRSLYLAWRLGRGNYRTGFSSLIRRVTGRYDDSAPGDMVEYHVVRNGVDQEAIEDLCRPLFRQVQRYSYWSNQPGFGQRIGEWLHLQNTFCIKATGYVAD